jgi:hypothetical protein
MKHVEKSTSVFNIHSLTSITASILLLFSVVSSPLIHPRAANADGLFQEQLSASFGEERS